MAVKPEPDLTVGMSARAFERGRAEPCQVIAEIKDGKARFVNQTDFTPLPELEVCGMVKYRPPEPVLRLFRPSGGFGNPMPYYGDEFRPEVQLWCVRTLGYTPRLCLEDCWERDESGQWPEHDSAWFCYFDSEGDKIAFILAFTGAETLDRFKTEDGI